MTYSTTWCASRGSANLKGVWSSGRTAANSEYSCEPKAAQ